MSGLGSILSAVWKWGPLLFSMAFRYREVIADLIKGSGPLIEAIRENAPEIKEAIGEIASKISVREEDIAEVEKMVATAVFAPGKWDRETEERWFELQTRPAN